MIKKNAIVVENLSKQFVTKIIQNGFWNNLKGLFYAKTQLLTALHALSFEVACGEKIAFIGPNGAGKSTAIKILTGIWHPSSGHASVLGLLPAIQREQLAMHIGVLFGQRSRLWPHLSPMDAFQLFGAMYAISFDDLTARLNYLNRLFSLNALLDRPIRQLSLGERMRCELVASLLHRPSVLFLDEPTVGLDINGKLVMRQLLNRLVDEEGVTLFLTSHDVADIEEVCDRVLIIDKGELVCDSAITDLKKKIQKKIIVIASEREQLDLSLPGITCMKSEPFKASFEVDLSTVSLEEVIHEAFKTGTLKDITIEDPPLEEIIRGIYGA